LFENKLQTNLKYHFLGANKPYISLDMYIDKLKIKYKENIDISNDLEQLRQNIKFYASGQELLRPEN